MRLPPACRCALVHWLAALVTEACNSRETAAALAWAARCSRCNWAVPLCLPPAPHFSSLVTTMDSVHLLM